MKAALMTRPESNPVYGDFEAPTAREGYEVVAVSASALSNFSKARSSGAHYSADTVFPSVAGAEGVGRLSTGQRVFFALPEAPFGALAEKALVRSQQCIPLPDALDDVTAAAIANPGMSAWAALVERAQLKRGETVLIHGATGSAGRLAVQVARYLGAGKIVATGRNAHELQSVGADIVIPFDLHSACGAQEFETALQEEFTHGIDVVIDYLWGESARTILVAIAKAVEDATPVRFVHVGSGSGEREILLPGAALRSSAIQLMGSGIRSVPFPRLLEAIRSIFEIAIPANLRVATVTMPLSEVEQAWQLPGKPRIVITIH